MKVLRVKHDDNFGRFCFYPSASFIAHMKNAKIPAGPVVIRENELCLYVGDCSDPYSMWVMVLYQGQLGFIDRNVIEVVR